MNPVPLAIQAVLAGLVLVAAVYDLRFRRIPNWLNLAGIVLGFGLHSWLSGLVGLRLAALGLVVAFGLNLLFYLIHALGAGDVKLFAAIGALVGVERFMIIFILVALAGGVLALLLMTAKGRVRKTLWNVAFLMGELVRLRAPYLRREELDVKSEKAMRLPRAVSIAAGTLAYLVWIRL
ncbi:MAG: A24 family peptidase [Acidobacteria bacterium]|nr:A24 family peptidase [Acidobacteriota bacterium]